MNCPLCIDEVLDATHRLGVEIDICPKCRGIWLDRGELDRLLGDEPDPERALTDTRRDEPRGRSRPLDDDRRRDDDRDRDRRRDDDRDRDDERYRDDERDRDDERYRKRRSKKKRLADLLDDILDL